ncbi:hypothetical protein HY837_00885 [archaeon]|nr:hypothetical protein [archaeon]
MDNEELKKIIDKYSEVTKKHGLYSYEASEFIKQYEDNLAVYDFLRFSRQLLRNLKEVLGEDLGTIEDKLTYYEDGKKDQ